MKVFVDPAKCADHGQCVFAAPEVFHLGDDGKLVYVAEPDDDLLDKVEEAADVCPLQAITVES